MSTRREQERMPPPWPDRLDSLRLEGIAQGGEAVGHVEGRVVFVQGGIPGELVSVRLLEKRPSYAKGQVEQVLEPSPDRVGPPCPLVGQCGGCGWQYIAYPAQLAFKKTIVEEQCRHMGGLTECPIEPTLGMKEPWRYRSTVEVHVAPTGLVGYYAPRSHHVVAADDCPLHVRPLNSVLLKLQRIIPSIRPADRPAAITLRYSWAEKLTMVLFQEGTRSGAAQLAERLADRVAEAAWQHGRHVQVLAGRGYLVEKIGGVSLRLSPTSFFQVNIPQARRMVQLVEEMLEPRPEDSLLDAYAGVGAISLPLARRVDRITAIESHPAAVADLRANVQQLRLDQVEAIEGLVERVLPAQVESQHYDLILLDPPRRGCEPAVLQAILSAQPRRIVYVSCHPGTLARDLKALRAGGYHLLRVQPLDMFPQTPHVESVALLTAAA